MAPPSGVLIAKEEEQGNKKKDRTESKIRMKSKFFNVFIQHIVKSKG